MSRLAEFLRDHIEKLGLSHKDVAGGFHTEHARRGARPFELSTIVTKLSKLLAGGPEGERFFFQDEARSGAFAVAVSVEELASACAASRDPDARARPRTAEGGA